ncbi:methylamine utilization protein MauE [Knoellia remsis]|uniref:Methylamine utilization protein MauE n=1 Tax=Knoellia remsis TaxID=407159 RepID=A0A2T0V0C7_9MICO|nr:MauE/DoxX family redox-associated membrane protein [Knoellia remsis]PRY63639.1 methylamine utilization protein MauE [Knoellia remsis]
MQQAAWVLAPLVLVAVLLLSAAAKVGKGASLQSVIANLRLPARILPARLARAIPAIELALALGLLLPWWPLVLVAAVATLGLMVVYWLLIARGLTITPRPSCGCFGQAGDHRIRPRTLLRNTLLVAAAVATVALAQSGRTVWSVLAGAAPGDVLWLALATLTALVTWIVAGGQGIALPRRTARQQQEPMDAPDGSDVDGAELDYVRTPFPSAVLFDPASGPATLAELARERAQLLVFVNCYCASTRDAMAAQPGWQQRLEALDVRLVFSVPIKEEFVGDPPSGTLLDHAALAWQAFDLTASPSAVLLGADQLLAGGPVAGEDEVRSFIGEIEEQLRGGIPDNDDGAGPEGTGTVVESEQAGVTDAR